MKMASQTNTSTAERRIPLSKLDSQTYEEWKSSEEEQLAKEKLEVLSESFHNVIQALGEDPKRDGLKKTPMRAAKALCFLTKGYEQSIKDIVGDGIFQEEYDELIVVSGIDFYSLCEHHLVPFYGKVSVGYLPHGKIVGLSKVARIVEMYSRRFQVQERLTRQIAEAIHEVVNPRGVGVIIEATHMCMTMRGVSKPGSKTVTSYMLGELRENPKTRGEFLTLTPQHTIHQI